MNISSLKIVKAQRRAINRVILFPLAVLIAVMTYLIVTNYQLEHEFDWSWLRVYLLPLIFMILFDAVLIFSAYKKSNIYQALADYNSVELAHIESQFDKKVSLFKTPLIYTDKVIFAAKGLSIRVIPLHDLIWLKHQTATGAIEIITRDKKNIRVHSQFLPTFFQQFVDKVKAHRPFVLFSSNDVSGPGKEYSDLFKEDFEKLVRLSDKGTE